MSDYQQIQIETATPTIGAFVTGVDLNNVRSQAVYDEIKAALWKHQVLFFRDQPLNPENYIALGKQFGDMEEHEFFPHVDGHPQIQTIASEGYARPETDRWHTDVTFREKPNTVSILRCIRMPESNGGDTLWANTAAAFDLLDDSMKRVLLTLTAEHDMHYAFRKLINFGGKYGGTEEETAKSNAMMATSGLDKEVERMRNNPPRMHPFVVTHHTTGRLHMFVNSIWTKVVHGFYEDVGDKMLEFLYEWIKKPEFQVRLRWQKDTVAIWDNHATQHYAVFDYAPHRREMQRMTCGAAKPELDLSIVPAHLLPDPRDTDRQTAGPVSVDIVDQSRLAAAPLREQAAVRSIMDALR